jgi:hypothetical protein
MHARPCCVCARLSCVARVQLVQSPSLPPQGVALELVYLPTSDLSISSTVLQELAGAVVAALPPDTPGRWATWLAEGRAPLVKGAASGQDCVNGRLVHVLFKTSACTALSYSFRLQLQPSHTSFVGPLVDACSGSRPAAEAQGL